MSRYQSTLPTTQPPAALDAAIRERLAYHGFKLVDDQANLWRKGGALSNPLFVQVQTAPGQLQLQAWIRMALLPGMYVGGEHDLEGMFLVIQKRQLRKIVADLEQLATR